MNVYQTAAYLQQRIVADLFPADTSRPPYPATGIENWGEAYNAHQNWQPSAEASAFERRLQTGADVQPGDLVFMLERTWVQRSDTLADLFEGSSNLYVVTKATKARVTVSLVEVKGWWNALDDAAKVDHFAADRPTQTFAVSSENRSFVTTGYTVSSFFAAMLSHPDWNRLQVLRAAVAEQRKRDDEKSARERAEHAAALKPFQTQAALLNRILGTTVATAPGYGEPRLEVTVDKGLLRLAVIGAFVEGLGTENDLAGAQAAIEIATMAKR